jgi:CRISPR-associated protein Cas1
VRRHLNTLYVTSDGAWLTKDGANVVVSREKAELGRVPIHTLGGIVCFGRVGMSPPLMGFCAEQGVCVCFLSDNGRFLARVEGPVSGNVLLRREQYRRADDREATAALVRTIVAGKALNSRAVIRRAVRDHGEAVDEADAAALCVAERRLTDIARRAEKTHNADALRGLEGEAAQVYFAVFDHLIRAQKDEFRFGGRSRRPPLDAVNALLSLLYTLLVHDCRSAAESVGLDPAVGFLHRDRPGRPSLALDLVEELRPVLADRIALTLINRRQLSTSDFRRLENGAVLLTDAGRKAVLIAYQERKRDELTHPFIGESLTLGLVPHVQAQLLARHLRGDLDGYPPFIWR